MVVVVGNQMGKVAEAGEVKEGMDFYRAILWVEHLAQEIEKVVSGVALEHIQTILGVVLVEDTLVEVHLTMVDNTMVVVVDPIILEATKPIRKANEKDTD